MQVTLREMHAIFTKPRFWIGFVAVIGMLTVMGPFGTLSEMEFARRLVYWASVSLLTFPVGVGVSTYFSIVLERTGMPVMLARLLAGGIAGIPITFAVWLVNLPNDFELSASPFYILRLASYAVPVAMAISLIYYLARSALAPHEAQGAVPQTGTARQAGPAASPAASPADAPAGSGTGESPIAAAATQAATAPAGKPAPNRNEIRFLQRLPVELGRDLISLQAQDHYVKAVTTKGSEMVLMRLADAEAELDGLPGLRVHRSWWVADAHLSRLDRRDGKPVLILDNGTEIPVSRTYLAEVRKHLDGRG